MSEGEVGSEQDRLEQEERHKQYYHQQQQRHHHQQQQHEQHHSHASNPVPPPFDPLPNPSPSGASQSHNLTSAAHMTTTTMSASSPNTQASSSGVGGAAPGKSTSAETVTSVPGTAAGTTTDSVVPDLMRVYESLTQSSTPQNPQQQQQLQSADTGDDHNLPPSQQQQQQQFKLEDPDLPPPRPRSSQSQDNNDYYCNYPPDSTFYPPSNWTFDASSLPIPPIPPEAYAEMAAQVPGSLPEQQPPTAPEPPSMPPAVTNDFPSNASISSSTSGQPPQPTGGGRSLRKRRSPSLTNSGGGGGGGGGGGASSTGNNNEETGSNSSTGGRGGSTSNTSNKRRKPGGGGGGGGKEKDVDGRWSKRFSWPEDLHRDFVSAIFDVGLKHASPSAILEHMPRHDMITSERIKSHLQKYRLHREKSKKEFMTGYESALHKMQSDGGMGNFPSLAGGEVPAHLTYTTMHDSNASSGAGGGSGGGKPTETAVKRESDRDASKKPAMTVSSSSDVQHPQQNPNVFMLPRLTEEEKRSPIGASMGYLMGLFFSLKQQLIAQRQAARAAQQQAEAAKAAAAAKNQPVAAVFQSFVNGQVPGYSNSGVDAAAAPDANNNISPSAAITPSASATAGGPSALSNLEESQVMKREMKNQMAFQNKMRALKQQELNKYKRTEDGGSESQGSDPGGDTREAAVTLGDECQDYGAASNGGDEPEDYPGSPRPDFQGAGEAAAAADGSGSPADQVRGRQQRGLSIGAAEEFWNTDIMDEQLFEFLMNN